MVVNLAEKTDWYCQLYGAQKEGDIFIDNEQRVKVQFIKLNDCFIELLEPLTNDSPLCTFLKSHGSGGIYHIAFEVDDLDKIERDVRNKGGIVVSRSKGGWNGMEVMFAIFFNGDQKQLIEYVLTK